MSRTDKDLPYRLLTEREPPYRRRQRRFSHPPHWYVGYVWAAPQRLAVRVDCRNAAKEHRGSGEVATVPTVRQHRHGAIWLRL